MFYNQKSTQGAWALCRRQAPKMQCMRDTKCRVVEHSVSNQTTKNALMHVLLFDSKMGFAHLPLYNMKTKGAM